MNRRTFLRQAAGAVTEAAVLSSTARSYARIKGANDRLLFGHVGIGNRGRGLEYILSLVKDSQNVETVALCDLWTVNRERAVATATVDGTAIPWVKLVRVGSRVGPTGGTTLSDTTFVQRVNTRGGLAPSTGCDQLPDVGKRAFMPYTADYFFYKE